MVLAGLGTSSTLMKSDAIATVGFLIEGFYNKLSPEYISEVSTIVLMILKEKNNEIYKATITFFKHLCKAHKLHKITDLPGLK